jgi:Reverse transcriptase (RNA-dependent DNA polymerase)
MAVLVKNCYSVWSHAIHDHWMAIGLHTGQCEIRLVNCYINCHTLSRAKRKRVCQEISKCTSRFDQKLIVVGDFNLGVADVVRHTALPAVKLRGSRKTFHRKGRPVSDLDHILTRIPASGKVKRVDISDHWPVVADIRVAEAPAEPALKSFIKIDGWNIFSDEKRWAEPGLDPRTVFERTKSWAEEDERLVQKVVAEFDPSRTLTKKTRLLRRRKLRCYGLMRRGLIPYSAYARIRKKAKRAIRFDRRNRWIAFQSRILSASGKIKWDLIRRMDPRTTNFGWNVMYNDQGGLATSERDIKNVWWQFYSNLFEDPFAGMPVVDDIGQVTDEHMDDDSCEVLNGEIAVEEFDAAVRQMRPNKAPGEDMLPVEFYKAAMRPSAPGRRDFSLVNSVMGRWFIYAWRFLFERGHVPPEWNTSILVPILKRGGDPRVTAHYRPIALMNVGLKVLNKVLANRLTKFLEDNNRLSTAQAGFRPKRECMEHVIALVDICQRRMAVGKNTYVGFIDLKKAYDSVNLRRLFAKMARMGICGKFLRYIISLYSTAQACVLVGGSVTDPIALERGVRQGCPLSPMLFNIYINDLPDYILPEMAFRLQKRQAKVYRHLRIKGLLWADDFSVMAASGYKLQQQFDGIDFWSRRNCMQLGVPKCGVMHIAPTGVATSHPLIRIGDMEVPRVDEYSYLGVLFNCRLNLMRIAVARAKATERAVASVHRFLVNPLIAYQTKLTIFKARVIPVAHWGGALLAGGRHRSDKVQSQVNRGLRLIFGGLPAANVHMAEANITPVFWAWAYALCRVRSKAQDLSNDCVSGVILRTHFKISRRGPRPWSVQAGRTWQRKFPSEPTALSRLRDLDIAQRLRESKIGSKYYDNFYQNKQVKLPAKKLVSKKALQLRMGTYWFMPRLFHCGKHSDYIRRNCAACNQAVVEDDKHIILDCPSYSFARSAILRIRRKNAAEPWSRFRVRLYSKYIDVLSGFLRKVAQTRAVALSRVEV